MSAVDSAKLRMDRPMAVAGAIVVAIVLGFVYATQRSIVKPELFEATSWSLLVMISFVGWGASLDALLFRDRRADIGLRAVWGASAMLFVGGVLASTSLFSRGVVLLLIDVGLVGAAVAAVRERHHLVHFVRFSTRAARINGLVSTLLVVVVFVAFVHFVGGVADPTSNPYDDDTAYFPFVRKLLQTGTLIEPFSFRRLSALGGQTFFLALLSPHATFRQMNAFDRGICVLLIAFLILGHKRHGRRMPLALTVFVLGYFLALPNNSINTAAHYAGFAFFLGMFRTMTHVEENDREVSKAVVLSLVAAATCTLRQNYLSVPVTMLGISYAYRVFGKRAPLAGRPWSERLREPLWVAGLSVVALVPWLVLAYRSNGTFLFPVQHGTFRRALELSSPTMTFLKDVKFLFSVSLENEPVKALSIIALAGALVRDDHPYKPLRSLWISSAIGLVILSHSFNLSDAGNLARYLYGFFAALAAAVILTAGTQPLGRVHDLRARAALYFCVGAMLVQLPQTREKATKAYQAMMRNIDQQRRRPPASPQTVPVEQLIHEHVQTFVPEGASFAAMVDYPYYFDFARNPIFNIDMPGYASLKPDMPYFQGPEKVAEYFLAHDIRYVVYVRPEHSHWLYQREFWFARMFNEEELWRLVAPYFVDLIDNFTALRSSRKVLQEEAGIVVLDLATPATSNGSAMVPPDGR